MNFNFKPRQGLSEMLELDAVKLAGQVDVLQTALIGLVVAEGGKELGQSFVDFLFDMDITAEVVPDADSTEESIRETQQVVDRYMEGINTTLRRFQEAVDSATDPDS